MEDENLVISYGGEGELPEITIRRKKKSKISRTLGELLEFISEEARIVSGISLASLFIYFIVVFLDLKGFLAYDQEKMNQIYGYDYIKELTREAYFLKVIFSLKSLYIGLGILLILAAILSISLWSKKIENPYLNKLSFSEKKKKYIVYGTRFFIAFTIFLTFLGAYILSQYVIGSIDGDYLYKLQLNIDANFDESTYVLQYGILQYGNTLVSSFIYYYGYVMLLGILTVISLIFTSCIARIHNRHKIMASSIIIFLIISAFVCFVYTNELLYLNEKRLMLTGAFLIVLASSLYLSYRSINNTITEGSV